MIRSFNGKTPKIAPSALIDDAAIIIGDVEIGENTSVWPGAVIRADLGKITIGKNCVIEDNSVIHSGAPGTPYEDVQIGDQVIIGHGAVLNCRSVGSNVLIGMNATLLHMAEIGNCCIIAAASLIPDSAKIDDYSLVVGVPGKVKGTPNEKQLWWIESAYKEYAKLMQGHRNS